MAINNSSNATIEELQSETDVLKYILYFVQGTFLAIINLFIVAIVLRHRMLRERKEYWVIAGLAVADVLNSLGFATAGVWRSNLVLSGRDTILVSSWYCMLTAHNIIWSVGAPMSGTLLLCVSIDRLISVAFPLEYYSFELGYAFKLVGAFYLQAFVCALIGVYVSYSQPDTPRYSIICFSDYAYGIDSWYNVYTWQTIMLASAASCVVYAIVIIVFRRSQAKTTPVGQQNDQQNEFKKAQKKLMVTLGISSVCSFFIYVIPSFMLTYAPKLLEGAAYNSFVPYSSIFMNLNPTINFFLYTSRHRDIRIGLKYLLLNKELNPNAAELQEG